jgi:hypothetical protein
MAEDLLTWLRETPSDIPESAPDLVGLRRRATTRRARRVLVVVVGTVVLVTGIVTPLALLSRLGTHRSFAPSARPTLVTPPLSVLSGSRPGWKRYIDSNYGVSIEIPDSWTFRDTASGPLGALTMFGVGSWPFPTGEDKDGCAPRPALDALPRRGAFLWIQEQGTGFPRRPKAFRLGRPTAPECVGGPSYLIDFRDAGRFFQVQIRFGPRASAPLRQRTLRVLDSFRATKN